MSDDKKDLEILELKQENYNNLKVIESYEEQNIKLTELEKKLRNQQIKYEKEKKIQENLYQETIKNLNSKITNLEKELLIYKKNHNQSKVSLRYGYDSSSVKINNKNFFYIFFYIFFNFFISF